MSKLTSKMYLTPFRFSHCATGDITWMLCSLQYKAGEHGALCASLERTVTVDLPEDFNPVAAEVASLKAQKARALEAYQRTLCELNERLSKLQAIANEVTA